MNEEKTKTLLRSPFLHSSECQPQPTPFGFLGSSFECIASLRMLVRLRQVHLLFGDGQSTATLRDPTVKFLREHLENAGCFVGEKFFKAVECDNHISGGYVPGQGILVCSNQMNIQDEVNQVVIHELIHAYDDCRAANLDWANCAHHACSEIRAGHLSGDCHYKRELLRGFMKIRGHEQECVRRRVMKSMAANPYCSESAARDAMEAVWDVCYNDTKPFDRAP